MAEQPGDALQAIGHGPWREVQLSARLPHVLAALDIDLEGLDQLGPHPAVGQDRPELARDRGVQQVVVDRDQLLEGELVRRGDPAVPADPDGRPQGQRQPTHGGGDALDARDRPAGDRHPARAQEVVEMPRQLVAGRPRCLGEDDDEAAPDDDLGQGERRCRPARSGRPPQTASQRVDAILDRGIRVAAPIRHRDDPVQVVRIEPVPVGRPPATGGGDRVGRSGAQDVLEQGPAHLGVVGHGLAIHRVVPVGHRADEQVDARAAASGRRSPAPPGRSRDGPCAASQISQVVEVNRWRNRSAGMPSRAAWAPATRMIARPLVRPGWSSSSFERQLDDRADRLGRLADVLGDGRHEAGHVPGDGRHDPVSRLEHPWLVDHGRLHPRRSHRPIWRPRAGRRILL